MVQMANLSVPSPGKWMFCFLDIFWKLIIDHFFESEVPTFFEKHQRYIYTSDLTGLC